MSTITPKYSILGDAFVPLPSSSPSPIITSQSALIASPMATLTYQHVHAESKHEQSGHAIPQQPYLSPSNPLSRSHLLALSPATKIRYDNNYLYLSPQQRLRRRIPTRGCNTNTCPSSPSSPLASTATTTRSPRSRSGVSPRAPAGPGALAIARLLSPSSMSCTRGQSQTYADNTSGHENHYGQEGFVYGDKPRSIIPEFELVLPLAAELDTLRSALGHLYAAGIELVKSLKSTDEITCLLVLVEEADPTPAADFSDDSNTSTEHDFGLSARQVDGALVKMLGLAVLLALGIVLFGYHHFGSFGSFGQGVGSYASVESSGSILYKVLGGSCDDSWIGVGSALGLRYGPTATGMWASASGMGYDVWWSE